jgi:RNA polymerase sigma factor (sigma-70 family)
VRPAEAQSIDQLGDVSMQFNGTATAVLDRPAPSFVRGPFPSSAPVSAVPVAGGRLAGEASDEALALAVRAGDLEAFGVLYARHVGMVRAYVSNQVSAADAREDLVQEVFTKALGEIQWGRYTPSDLPNSFRRWLVGRMARIVITVYGKGQWRQRRAREDSAERLRLGPVEPGEEHIGVDELTNEAVKAAFAQLTPRQRQALELIYLEGQSYEQAAQVMGVTLATAAYLREAATKRIRGNEAVRTQWLEMPPQPKRSNHYDKGKVGSGSFYQQSRDGRWVGRVWVATPDGSTRRIQVSGKDRDAVYARWQQLRAQVLAAAGEQASA